MYRNSKCYNDALQNTRCLFRFPDGDTSFFDIIAGVLQGDTLAPFLFVICLDYVLRKAIDEKQIWDLH